MTKDLRINVAHKLLFILSLELGLPVANVFVRKTSVRKGIEGNQSIVRVLFRIFSIFYEISCKILESLLQTSDLKLYSIAYYWMAKEPGPTVK